VAHVLSKEIGIHAARINAANLGNMFGLNQMMLAEHFTVSLTKLFERDSSRNPIMSIASTLHFLEEHATELAVGGCDRVMRELLQLDAPIDDMERFTGPQLTIEIVRRVDAGLPDISRADKCSLSASLVAWRASRDKRVVHNEDLSAVTIPPTTWETGLKLLDYAKHFISLVGWGYLDRAYTFDDGEYHQTRDAERAALALRRLLRSAGICADDEKSG
jgi:hypothetical protein